MTSGPLLDPDLRESARLLLRSSRIRTESDPDRYRTAVRGYKELAAFFRDELGWSVEIHEVAELVRLHKRRVDVPGDRGPRLEREGRTGPLAPAKVLIVVALICEQMWRRPRMSLRELAQAIAQVCAAEAATGRLPTFPIVPSDGVAKQEAQRNRQHLIDALKLLVAEGTVSVDSDLDRAVADEDSDLVVSASRDRLAAKFSSLSPALLGLDDLPAEQHAAALSAESLLDHTSGDQVTTIDDRRLKVMRRLADDPATDPLDDDAATTPYLHSLTGRERALNVAASLGLAAGVRRDWWEITDPTGLASDIDFPNGRRSERQAALALLAIMPRRQDPAAPLPVAEVVILLEQIRQDLSRWAAAYDRRLPALARMAAGELVRAGLLTADSVNPDQWLPTPGIHLWRIRARQTSTGQPVTSETTAAQGAIPRVSEQTTLSLTSGTASAGAPKEERESRDHT